jgi:hypothetical protein
MAFSDRLQPVRAHARPANEPDMKSTELAVIILAARRRTRMKSRLPKVMHRIAGRTLLATSWTR